MKTKTLMAICVLGVATVTACGSSNSGFTASGAGSDAASGGNGQDSGTNGGASASGGSSSGGGSTGGKTGSGGSSGAGGSSGGGSSNSDASTPPDSGVGGSAPVDAGGADAPFIPLIDAGSLGPTVSILHPGAGTDRTVNVSIYFHATATDPTDGALTGNALVWTDSLEGQFGTGDPVNWAPTVTGSHTITVLARDSLGYTATDSITFNIIP